MRVLFPVPGYGRRKVDDVSGKLDLFGTQSRRKILPGQPSDLVRGWNERKNMLDTTGGIL